MTVIVFVGLLFGFTVRARATSLAMTIGAPSDSTVRTPAAGSATRTAILNAVRARLDVKSRFKVGHVRANDRWAFVRCVEVVDDGGALQETDLDVAALLERRPSASGQQWRVVELWALSTDDERPYTPFARRIRERVRTDRLPTALFPRGFLTSDVPVE